MNNNKITIAVPRGRIIKDCQKLLNKLDFLGYACE